MAFKKVIKDSDKNPQDGGKDFDPASVRKPKNSISGKATMKVQAPGDLTEETGSVRKSKDYKSLMGSLRQRGGPQPKNMGGGRLVGTHPARPKGY